VAACLFAVVAAPVRAQQAAGDWTGTLRAGWQSFRIAVHLHEAADGALSGTYDSLDRDQFDVPVVDIAKQTGRLAFGRPDSGGRFEGRWDRAAGGWVGRLTVGTQAFPLTLKPGRFARGPTFVALEGAWAGATPVGPGLRASLSLRFRSTPYGTTGMLTGLDFAPSRVERIEQMDGRYRLTVATSAGTFEMTLKPAGDALAGELARGDARFPLSLARAADAP
jgi:hypothetical protein